MRMAYSILTASFFCAAFLMTAATDVRAQASAPETAAPVSSRLPDRIVRPMRAVDQLTLRAEGVTLRLWGIKPGQTNETPLELKALDLMDSLIQERQVNCKIAGGVMPELVARCVTSDNRDLALELLASGLVVVDRRQTYDTVFATAYEKAQETARLNEQGVWALIKTEQNRGSMPKWLENHMAWLLPLALMIGPFGGLLIVALVVRHWLKSMSDAQSAENLRAQQKESMLQARERQVLLTTLEGELQENKNKIEAFLVIYSDMLRGLREGADTPKYQQIGDIVQKHPNFGKTVFESNVNKLSLLDMKTAGRLSKIYSAMPKENEYINLDQSVPLDTAVKLVEKVLKEAEDMLPQIQQVIDELQASQATA
jgi:endonuclease YncB( thermonuclease family)